MINNLEFVERLRRRKNTQRYQQLLSTLLQREVILQSFPALKALPLPLHYPDGTPCSIEGALANRSRILLCAEPGAGAQIALAQLTARWCEQPASNVPLPFPIDVSSVDQAYASPIACLSALLLSQQEVSGQPLRLQLLISGWEELPATRREAWRVALCGSLPERVVQIVVVVPHAERLWQGFAPVIVGRPDLALQARIGRPIHLPHPAFAKQRGDFVDTESCTGCQRHAFTWPPGARRLSSANQLRTTRICAVAMPAADRSPGRLRPTVRPSGIMSNVRGLHGWASPKPRGRSTGLV